jgi:hypothetical protein
LLASSVIAVFMANIASARSLAAACPAHYDVPASPLLRAERGASMASVPVGIRLSREVWARHSAAAQGLGLPLSVYLRQRLDAQDGTAAALAELQATLNGRAAAPAASNEPNISPGLLVELLLLLRQIAGPQRVGLAHKEVERRGLDVWK